MAKQLSLFIVYFAAILCAGCTSAPQAREPLRLLFVGNSLTYVGNLPAVVDALAATNHRLVQSDMIAKGGATLTQHRSDGSVARALLSKNYDYVLLQERGGDFICSFGPSSCHEAEASLAELTRLAKMQGAKVILLGTYQQLAAVSVALVEAEATAATRLSITHIPVSQYFQAGVASKHQADWLDKDGAHPGHDLILLEAMLLYRHLFGALPGSSSFSVHAPMRGSASELTSHNYTADRVGVVLDVVAGTSP
ncbi:MAG: hypothetical protein CFE43_19735 [Burkholderiales bacterium PBB3]|nr:MAG: hypothetical protein CFE43_19735 [Burkholderiales bacterium PBB3]